MAVPMNSDNYYHGIYWNSYSSVVRHLNQLAFDSEEGNWCEFLRRERGRPYQLALSLNCGNGWVERDLITADAVKEILAIDFFDDLIAEAQRLSEGLPITFIQADTNQASFPCGPFDLVVNHAAGHHITYLDRVFRRLWTSMTKDGTLVTWDYMGPHRNQYSTRIWQEAHRINDLLPSKYRATMDYPHLPTMISTDPSEAVHSELLLEVMSRYFRFRHFRPLGGAIAYLVLTHNNHLFEAPDEIRDELVRKVIEADVRYMKNFPMDSLFTFCLASPRHSEELDPLQFEIWTVQEEMREVEAEENGGIYFPQTALARSIYPVTEQFSAFEPADLTGYVAATPASIARLGPRLVFSAMIRSVALRVPLLLSIFRRTRMLVRRFS